MKKDKPSFLDYYASQILSLKWEKRKIAKNKKTGVVYEEVNFKTNQIILFVLIIMILIVLFFIRNDNINPYFLPLILALLYPLRYFFVKFKKVADVRDEDVEN